ncbi:MAG: hypothetical protein GEU93_04130 [Propionibacteriales bacterium]|nr:hypothetical protein [Propionibacteriales bacterium]
MDIARLGQLLHEHGVDPDSYSLTGGHQHDAYVIDQRPSEWVVYYSERGSEFDLRSFPTEGQACRHLADLLWPDSAPTDHRW